MAALAMEWWSNLVLAPCIVNWAETHVSSFVDGWGLHTRWVQVLCTCKGNGDRLILRRMRCHGNHGVFPEERTLGQKFDVDLDAWIDLSKAGETDNLDDSRQLLGNLQVRRMLDSEMLASMNGCIESLIIMLVNRRNGNCLTLFTFLCAWRNRRPQ